MDSTINCHYNNLSKKVFLYAKFESFCENIIKTFNIPVRQLKDIKLYIIFNNEIRIDIDDYTTYKEYILEDINLTDIYCELDKTPKRQNPVIKENNVLMKINNLENIVKQLKDEINKYELRIKHINDNYEFLEKQFNEYKIDTQKKINEMESQIFEKQKNLKNAFNQMNKIENRIEGNRRIRGTTGNEKRDYNEQNKNQNVNNDDKIYRRKENTPTPQTENIQTPNPPKIKEQYNNNNNNYNYNYNNNNNNNNNINTSNENNYIDFNNNINSINSNIKNKNEISNYKEKDNIYIDKNEDNLNNNINNSDYNYKKIPSNIKTNNGNYNKNNDNLINSNMNSSENYKKNNEIKMNNNKKRKTNLLEKSGQKKLSCEFIINNPLIKNISEIKNKLPIKYVIQLKNNGIEQIPKNCDIVGDPKSNLFIMETMVNNGNIILPRQKIEVSLFIFFRNYDKIQIGMNQLNIVLRHKELGKIGETGQIKINITDCLGENDKMIISQTNPDIRKKIDDFTLLRTNVGNDLSSSNPYNNK